MAIEFNLVNLAPLRQFSAFAPDGTVVGVVGENGSGKRTLLRAAAGTAPPVSGTISAGEPRHWIGEASSLDFPAVRTLLLEHTFARHDAVARAGGLLRLERLRREGATVLLVSHEEELLLTACDELWWLREGGLAARGSPDTVLDAYRHHLAARLRAWGEGNRAPLSPCLRRGDGRAEVLDIETLGRQGQPTMVWGSGEPAEVRVTLRFHHGVEDPVVGIMLRNRIGMEVYGTNTLLEKLALGPRREGDTIRVSFAFTCDLCPQEYTLTVASHDPGGVWHDWLEDAVTFLVTDSRYAAGVANLRARVSLEVLASGE